METFGRFLEPNILAAIRRELNPAFQEGELSSAIKSMLGDSGLLENLRQGPSGKSASPPLAPAPAIVQPASALPGETSVHQTATGLQPATTSVSHGPAEDGASDTGWNEGQDITERLIRIIMDATGFNRDEIQPDMDLRRDLSIRSSRLPIIMDTAEQQFGITIELEDFIGVRTVQGNC